MKKLLLCVVCLVPLFSFAAITNVFMISETIQVTNDLYEGSRIVVDGCTLTVDGTHGFESLRLTNSAVLNHSACTTSVVYSIDVSLTNDLFVSSDSKIDVTGLGYMPGYTVGNTTNGGTQGKSGGSYGGYGYERYTTQAVNDVYGDFRDPQYPGSGGGIAGASSKPGGGLVRLVVGGTALVDGMIVADGGGRTVASTTHDGGGSGGGVYLSAGLLVGDGSISANGGTSADYHGGRYYADGGGGRVAIYYGTDSGFLRGANVMAATPGSAGLWSAPGTVYLKQTGQAGVLRVDGGAVTSGMYTVLGMLTDTVVTAEQVIISGTGVKVCGHHGIPFVVDGLVVTNEAAMSHLATTTNATYSLDITVNGNMHVASGASMDVTGLGYLPGYTVGNTTSGASQVKSGGSYGGLGYERYTTQMVNDVYGDFRDPQYPGSGGGAGSVDSSAGGGLIRISVLGTAVVDGVISANGGEANWAPHGGGGSGGGIYLSAGVVDGVGIITANGGTDSDFHEGRYCADGGGGRVAVVYGADRGFLRGTNVTAYQAGGVDRAASVGTVYLQQTGQTGRLLVACGVGYAPSGYTPLGVVGDSGDLYVEDLVCSGTGVVVCPHHELMLRAESVTVTNGAQLSHLYTDASNVYSLELLVTNNLVVAAGSSIDVTARGYMKSYWKGNTTLGGAEGRAGGSYGGLASQWGTEMPNAVYGDAFNPRYPGAGSGARLTYGDAGGGLLRLTVGGTTRVDGSVLAVGGYRGDYNDPGGAGGGICLNTRELEGAGVIRVDGGAGNNGSCGGSGGRVAVYAAEANHFTMTNITSIGGRLASTGTVYVASTGTVYFALEAPSTNLLHGMVPIQWRVYGVHDAGYTVDVLVMKEGVENTLVSGAALYDSVDWSSTLVDNGWYTLRIRLMNGSGHSVSSADQFMLVNNAVQWHSGTLSGDEIWSNGVVHVLEADVVVPSNVTLEVESGAVVKSMPGVQITVYGALEATGTSSRVVTFTAMSDDTVGGDTNLDGSKTIPVAGYWRGVNAAGGGTVSMNDDSEIWYALRERSGMLGADESWKASFLYSLTDTLTISNGVTLTIEPGVVIKAASGKGIEVQAGGVLQAVGTVAQPVVFTSVKDDTVGGDLNGDGSGSSPAAGDWKWLRLETGATGLLHHCMIRYGGNSGTDRGMIDSHGVLDMMACWVEESLYDGIESLGGSAVMKSCVVLNCDRGAVTRGGVLTVVNCTFYKNRIGIVPHGGSSYWYNNVVANSIDASTQFNGGIAAFAYNNLWPDPYQSGVSGNLSTNPVFVDADGGNFRLDYGSPCIDAADTPNGCWQDYMDAGRVNDPRTLLKHGVAGSDGIYADMGAYEFIDHAASDVDLIAVDVAGPAQGDAGALVTVEWMVRNVGSATISNSWHDEIQLVPVNPGLWDSLLVVTQVLSQGELGPGQALSFSADVKVPAATEGNWRWQVKVNAEGSVFEGENWKNNAASANSMMQLSVAEIAVNGSMSAAFVGDGRDIGYRVVQPANTALKFSLYTADDGYAKIYAGYGCMPKADGFSKQVQLINASDALLQLPSTNVARTVYLRINPTQISGGVSYTAAVEMVGFGIDELKVLSGGNVGVVSIPITGSSLKSSVMVALSPVAGGSSIQATEVQVVDGELLVASFDLSGARIGLYDVVASQDVQMSMIPSGFNVYAGTGGKLEVKVLMPKEARAGRQFTGYVWYKNVGDCDVIAPLMVLEANSKNTKVWSTRGRSGEASQFNFMGVVPESSLYNVIPPGVEYAVDFYVKASDVVSADCRVSHIPVDDPGTMNYESLRNSIRPPDASAQWSNAWQLVVNECGRTKGEYVTKLGEACKEAASQQKTLIDERTVLKFMIDQRMEDAKSVSVSGRLYDGSVTNAMLGNHVVRLELTYDPESTGQIFQATTAYDGKFIFDSVSNGSYYVAVPGYELDSQIVVAVGGLAQTGLAVVVGGEAPSLYGYVYDGPAGLPVTNAVISARDTLHGSLTVAGSDAQGYYSFNDLSNLTYTLDCAADGWTPASQVSVELSTNQSTVRHDFYLDTAGGSITGVVTDASSNVVKMAWVNVTMNNGSSLGYGAWSSSANTDSNGCYKISKLPLVDYRIRISAKGYADHFDSNVAIKHLGGVVDHSVELDVGTTVTGVVVDAASGNPISGARIFCSPDSGSSSWETDGAGVFVASNRALGWIQFSADKEGYTTAAATGVVDGVSGPIRLVLSQVGQISGQVSLNGHVASEVLLTLVDRESQLLVSVRTDMNGAYGISAIPTGSYSIAVGDMMSLSKERYDFEIASTNATVIHNISLNAASCYGLLTDSTGGVVRTDTEVCLLRGTNVMEQKVTDSGEYFFAIYHTGVYHVVAQNSRRIFEPVMNVVVTNLSGYHRNDMGSSDNELSVYVTRDGVPETNAQVTVSYVNGPATGISQRMIYTSGTNGIYTFNGLLNGGYRVSASSVICPLISTSVTLTQSMQAASISLAVGRTLSGTVTVESNAYSSAIVTALTSDGSQRFSTMPEADGGYSLSGLPADNYRVYCLTYGAWDPAISNVNLTSSTTAVWAADMAVKATSTVAGVVYDSASNRVTGAAVSMVSTGGIVWCYAATDNSGEFEIKGWPAGESDLRISCEGYITTYRRLTNNAGVSVTGLVVNLYGPCSGVGGITNMVPFAVGGTQRKTTLRTVTIVPPFLNWLSGSGALEPPANVWDNYGIDDTMDKAVNLITLLVNNNMDCPEVWDNYNNLRAAYRLAAMAMDGWKSTYDAVMLADGANVGMVTTRAGLVAAQLTKVLMSFGNMTGASPKGELFANLMDFGTAIASTLTQGFANGDFGGVQGALGGLGDFLMGVTALWESGDKVSTEMKVKALQNTIAKMKADPMISSSIKSAYIDDVVKSLHDVAKGTVQISKSVEIAGKLAGLAGVYNEAVELYKELMNMNKELLELLQKYKNAQDQFNKAAADFQKAANRFFSSAYDCPPDPDEPVDPPSIPIAYGHTTILASYDPNDKQSTGIGEASYVATAERVYYTIRFENVATAAVPAQVVTVSDALSSDLDWATVELGNIGFNNEDISVPSGLISFGTNTMVTTDPNPVRVNASFNQVNGMLRWTIESYDPSTGNLPADPHAGFLPPNTTKMVGEGYVSFSVQVSSNLASSASITNLASIVFDVNVPIITPSVVNTLDNAAPSSRIPQLQNRVPRVFPVEWTGSDSGGSGVARYDVYVSVDSNAYGLWVSRDVTDSTVATDVTEGVYTGVVRSSYAFLVRAVDLVGNVESKSAPDATTTVGVPLKNDFDGDGRSDIGCYYQTEGFWYVYKSTAGFWTTQFGYEGTKPISGDFDGDNICDYGTYAAGAGQWKIVRSSEGEWDNNFGYAGTVPVTGDFDGDGLCDFGCYYAPGGNWYLYKSKDGFWINNFGYEGTVPVTGDFDGDGVADFGCFYAPGGNWYLYKSKDGFWTTQFGYEGTLPVTGDFDGDGLCDFGCYYPEGGNWYIYKSRDGFWVNNFGYAGTLPISGDYDGDVIDDFGCYFAPGGNWYIYQSSEGFYINQFGYEGTVPVGE